MKTRLVKTLGELLDAATPAEPEPVSGRIRPSCVYRGVSQPDRRLLTSLDRLGGTEPPHSKVHLEEHLLRNFIRYGKQFLPENRENLWEIMVIAEHHGVPTRLLDWSYSPLIAAHFATLGDVKADRAIWRLDWKKVHRRFGFPELALLIEDLHRLLGRDGAYTPWKLIDEGTHAKPFACMIEPPTLDARISAQAATFTLCSDTNRSFDDFLAEYDLQDALSKFVIPESATAYIRDQLDLVGVDERRLFPDLDGVAAQMRRYYS